jgi:hypothetical protein
VSAPLSMAPGGLGRRGIGWRRGRGPRLAAPWHPPARPAAPSAAPSPAPAGGRHRHHPRRRGRGPGPGGGFGGSGAARGRLGLAAAAWSPALGPRLRANVWVGGSEWKGTAGMIATFVLRPVLAGRPPSSAAGSPASASGAAARSPRSPSVPLVTSALARGGSERGCAGANRRHEWRRLVPHCTRNASDVIPLRSRDPYRRRRTPA